MENKILEDILEEIKLTNKLALIYLTSGLKAEEQISLLSDIGLQPKDIAERLGTTANYVRVTLHRLRKSKTKSENK